MSTILRANDGRTRCPWPGSDERYLAYHDEEWGTPLRDEGRLFELLLLEGAQAGLSWLTVLRKREAYRVAFDRFDPARIARYGDAEKAALLGNPGIVRNRLKVDAFIRNARAYLDLTESEGSFSAWLWNFVDGRPIVNSRAGMDRIPAQTPLSEKISKELKGRGFTFVGPTIIYAYMQSAGLVNDHLDCCFRRREILEA